MLKPIRWKTFHRDFVVIDMSNILRLTPGTMVVIDGVWVLGLALLLKEKIGIFKVRPHAPETKLQISEGAR